MTEIDCRICLPLREEEAEVASGINKPLLSLLLYWQFKVMARQVLKESMS